MTGYEISLRDDAVCRALACGAKRTDILTAYDLTPSALESIRATNQGKIDQYRQRLQLATQLNEQFLKELAPQAARNIETLLHDSSHKQHYEISWKVLEHALPKTTTLEGSLGLAMSEDTAVALAQAIGRLAENRTTQPTTVSVIEDPNLLDSPQ